MSAIRFEGILLGPSSPAVDVMVDDTAVLCLTSAEISTFTNNLLEAGAVAQQMSDDLLAGRRARLGHASTPDVVDGEGLAIIDASGDRCGGSGRVPIVGTPATAPCPGCTGCRGPSKAVTECARPVNAPWRALQDDYARAAAFINPVVIGSGRDAKQGLRVGPIDHAGCNYIVPIPVQGSDEGATHHMIALREELATLFQKQRLELLEGAEAKKEENRLSDWRLAQLAACGTAALDGSPDHELRTYDPAWSPAYADVLKLRREVEQLRAVNYRAREKVCRIYRTADRYWLALGGWAEQRSEAAVLTREEAFEEFMKRRLGVHDCVIEDPDVPVSAPERRSALALCGGTGRRPAVAGTVPCPGCRECA